jgi:hypothetical protein
VSKRSSKNLELPNSAGHQSLSVSAVQIGEKTDGDFATEATDRNLPMCKCYLMRLMIFFLDGSGQYASAYGARVLLL